MLIHTAITSLLQTVKKQGCCRLYYFSGWNLINSVIMP